MSTKPTSHRLPARIRDRLDRLEAEIRDNIEGALAEVHEPAPGRVSYKLTHSAPCAFPSPDLQAQALGFVIRYEQLPSNYTVDITCIAGTWQIANLEYLRHVLNDFRPLIHNQNDSVYYKNVHNTWCPFLLNNDPSTGLSIRVLAEDRSDVTDSFRTWLGQRRRATGRILDALEFGYLYNGVLQHADPDLSERFVDEYVSGELNYAYWKHMATLSRIRQLLVPYYRMLNAIARPKRGGL